LSPIVVFVGEAPGVEEDRTGLPFVGRAGKRLDDGIARAGIPAETVGVLNVLKCRPPANRFDPAAAKTCRPYLDRQLEWLDPRLVVTLGRWALATLEPQAPSVMNAAGAPRDWNGRRLLPLLHPASTFRSRAYFDRWQRDLQALEHEFARYGYQTL
jgi:DNA polymerase